MTKKDTREPRKIKPRTVRVRPQSFQPRKADMMEDVSIKATPEDVIRAAFHPARVIEDPDA
ncbi:MAG: hypothetical protein OXQ84_04265 [bacterium]|nr:hypothetical protein [bacterium]